MKKSWKKMMLCMVMTTAFLTGCGEPSGTGVSETPTASMEEARTDSVKFEETQKPEPEKGTAYEADEKLENNEKTENNEMLENDEIAENDVPYKTYYLQSGEQSAPVPGLTLYEDGHFSFSYDILSSYLNYGTYQMEDGILTAVTNDGLYHFVFKEEDGQYLFVKGESSEVTLTDPRVGIEVTDGAVFAWKEQKMTAVVKEVGEDYFLVSSRTDEMPGVYEVYFGETDESSVKGGDEIEIVWDRPLAEGNHIYAKSVTLVPEHSESSNGSSS
ncbi:hypothetical protein GPL15_15475 [Clostridium sp. MCC353]|uniref:hypothetical protein n=1 Tax=Clostridium sp. MCC353 TaxID=2592646 RepID=UPI001C038873|nr:hypothetical protein [Clostridium sp. MCC353]MBT9777902.1 hypothetical protein [Clostridium sp. MCC353]